ncbi:2' O-ribose methyltransferase [Spiromyces aspiralis]|uniref:2' O-ribose methyltransferase n=1 Tax=Spiromyces aspiralis TaxID=68401 RepID=A0ACC1HDN3_9FUNG|nr:2' O-ribose methyltransferase [Spiromyces aspiralis]
MASRIAHKTRLFLRSPRILGISQWVPVRYKSSSSSKRWTAAQASDPFVKAAKADSYRARSSYKLIELDKKYDLIRPKDEGVIVDCGSAPGGWCQVLARLAQVKRGNDSSKGLAVAVDLLPMLPIAGVQFIQGDFTDASIKRRLSEAIGDRRVKLVLSDMAPAFSGHHTTDHARSMNLCENVMAFADEFLSSGGSLVCKYFMGGDENELRAELRKRFARVLSEKPDSSRKRSSERYFVCIDKKPDIG